MSGNTTLCKLEVLRGTSERTIRTFNINVFPKTLLETEELLKRHDLRLQYKSFEFTVARGENDEQKLKLSSDGDVVAFFADVGPAGVFFTAMMEECTSGVGSSMLADDTLVNLSIQHPCGVPATEKRFIPPKRDVWKALKVAVRDSIPRTVPANQKITILAINEGEVLREVSGEDEANMLIRACIADQCSCRLTYKITDEPTGDHTEARIPCGDLGKSPTGGVRDPKTIDNRELPNSGTAAEKQTVKVTTAAQVVVECSQTVPPPPSDVEENVRPETSLESEKEKKGVSQESTFSVDTGKGRGEKDYVKQAPAPELGKKSTKMAPLLNGAAHRVKPVIGANSAAYNLHPLPTSEPKKLEGCRPLPAPAKKAGEPKPGVSPRPIPSLLTPIGKKEPNSTLQAQEHSLSREEKRINASPGELLTTDLGGSPSADREPNKTPSIERLPSNRNILPPEVGPNTSGDVLVDTPKVRAGEAANPTVSPSEGNGGTGLSPRLSDEDLPDEAVVEVVCSMEAATPPPFFFTWKKGSPTVMETLYSKCMSALNLTDVDNFMIYDHTGFPLCSPRSVAVMMGSAIREKSNRVEVSVVKGHPCTSGLPLQCFFTWGTQQFVQTLVLRPNNILKDIRTALADECGLKVREANELSFSLFDQDECVGMELTPDNAYEELKRASEEKTVVHISVLDRRRTSLMAFSVRSLEEAATALADELELSHNCYLGDVRVTSVLRRCCEYSSPAEQDRVERYVDAIVEGMKGSGTLRREELVAAIVREASCCGQDVALLFVNRCIATTRLMLSHRPFDMLARFFRRLYRSLDFPGKAEDGIPLNVVLRQLAYAGLSDVGWLLFRGRSFPSVVSEWDFTEILQRLYAGNPNIVSRVAVASRLSGISSITNRHVITKEERELLQAECRHEMVHAFDGIQLSEVLTFVQQHKLHMKPQYCSLLGTVSTLLANYSQKLSSQWLVERCTARTGIPVDTMLRSFQDSQIPVPLLYQLCWDMLRPEVHYLTLLPDSCVASAFAYWALFAVQLVCANRNLEFPPVALVDLREFSWISRGKPPSCAAVGEAGGALSLSVPAVVPREGVVKKIKYKYSYLCRDLRREHHLQPIVK